MTALLSCRLVIILPTGNEESEHAFYSHVTKTRMLTKECIELAGNKTIVFISVCVRYVRTFQSC